jgi:hypothetical protein
MRKVTINIPDSKYQFFMELIHNLGFDKEEEIEIPEEQKTIVRERIKNSKSEDLISWNDAREMLLLKTKP